MNLFLLSWPVLSYLLQTSLQKVFEQKASARQVFSENFRYDFFHHSSKAIKIKKDMLIIIIFVIIYLFQILKYIFKA